jgi:hypothetical protein
MFEGTGFTGCGKTPVLYQGTTSVVPHTLENKMGFSPCHGQSYHKSDFFRSLFSPYVYVATMNGFSG